MCPIENVERGSILGNRYHGGKWIVLFSHAHFLNFFEELCKLTLGW